MTATVAWTGAAHRPAPDGFTIEIVAIERWTTWRATIAMDDGATFELFGPTYDGLVERANRFVAAVIEHRLAETTLAVAVAGRL